MDLLTQTHALPTFLQCPGTQNFNQPRALQVLEMPLVVLND
jgi:hypothetical protein